MINSQALVDRMTSVLDAEGSERYLFEQDFKPAINSSIDWLVAVFNAAFSDNKLSEEDLRELVKTSIWQANSFSRIHFNQADLGYRIWTILGIFPKPTITPVTTPPPLNSPESSTFRGDLSYVDSYYAAKRLTIEEWNENRKNVFAAGNEVLKNQLESYAYLGHGNYGSSNYNAGGEEIQIRPSVSGEFVAVTLLKNPDKITSITDDIEFPETVFDLLFQKALNFISYKQGDNTSLFAVTAQDVSTLVKLMV
jgi:hypothetical protein